MRTIVRGNSGWCRNAKLLCGGYRDGTDTHGQRPQGRHSDGLRLRNGGSNRRVIQVGPRPVGSYTKKSRCNYDRTGVCQRSAVYEKMIHLFQGCGSTPHNAPHFSKSLDSSGRGSKRAKPTKGSPNQPVVRTSCRQLPISPAATAPGG